MTKPSLLVTCGLPYTNGKCHLGHLRTYVPADFYVRYKRRSGADVTFICGSDNHGTPIVVSAEAEGVTPREISERYHHHFDQTFQRMHVSFDSFGMTDDPTNRHRTTSIVKRMMDAGYVYPKTIRQAYCPTCSRFLPDRFLKGICPYCGLQARGDECDQGCGKPLAPEELKNPSCATCRTPAEFRNQEHYFMKLGEFGQILDEFLQNIKGTENARNYAKGWLREGLHDWCITRTLDWGIPFPGNEELTVYVWVDAPIGYISFTEDWAKKRGVDWREKWCSQDSEIIHFIGVDITYHHCLFWPAMLHAAGYKMPDTVIASGMVKIDGQKFSKSRGYVIWTNEEYLDLDLCADYLRYYLLSYTNHTKELNFSWKVFQDRINNEVVNTLGNFLYRSMHFAYKEYNGIPRLDPKAEIFSKIQETLDLVESSIQAYEFKEAVDAIMALCAYGNNYIQNSAPWAIKKTDPQAAQQIIADCLQLTKALAILVEPIMPEHANQIWDLLGVSTPLSETVLLDVLQPLYDNATLKKPEILFKKLDDELIEGLEVALKNRVMELSAQAENAQKELETKGAVKIDENIQNAPKSPCSPQLEPFEILPEITIDEFSKLDLRVGKIIEAEPIPKSNKLLRIQVNIGSEIRQIVSGIASFYEPKDLIGKNVVVICNLKPAQLMGVSSCGMILAAGDKASLLTPISDVAPGTKIK
jgi:methionyl-tRNA synthetase